jgi:hypothetical protein
MNNEARKLEALTDEVRGLLHEYQELAGELASHHDDPKYQHQLHELEEHMQRIKESLRTKGPLDDRQKQISFLDHHMAAVCHVNDHMHQTHLHLSYLFETTELDALKQDMLKVLGALESKKQEIEKHGGIGGLYCGAYPNLYATCEDEERQ